MREVSLIFSHWLSQISPSTRDEGMRSKEVFNAKVVLIPLNSYKVGSPSFVRWQFNSLDIFLIRP